MIRIALLLGLAFVLAAAAGGETSFTILILDPAGANATSSNSVFGSVPLRNSGMKRHACNSAWVASGVQDERGC